MKKFLAITFLAITLVGCSKSPDEKLLGIINDATEKMKDAKNLEEAAEINKAFVDDIDAFEQENKTAYDEIEKDHEKMEKVQAAGQNYSKVMVEKMLELNSQKKYTK